MNVRTFHCSFEMRPMSFNGVCVMNTAHPFIRLMIDHAVIESKLTEAPICAMRIG